MKTTTSSSPLIQSLARCFGSGAPGWLGRDVPVNTVMDFAEGRVASPAGTFVRVPGAHRWARVG